MVISAPLPDSQYSQLIPHELKNELLSEEEGQDTLYKVKPSSVNSTVQTRQHPLSARVGELFFLLFFNLTYSRWASLVPSCVWSLDISPSLPRSRLPIFYRDASSALLQLVNQ